MKIYLMLLRIITEYSMVFELSPSSTNLLTYVKNKRVSTLLHLNYINSKYKIHIYHVVNTLPQQ